MIAKISLAAAFFLMVAPPMACASNRDATNPALITRNAHRSSLGMVVAQDNQPNAGISDNDNGNDSNDSADDNQNADGNQTDQNAAVNQQVIPPQVLNGPENDPDDAPDPNGFAQPVNPSQ